MNACLGDLERFLHDDSEGIPPLAAGEATIQLNMTKRVLAAELGTSSETLSRTFALLRAEKLLDVKGNALRVRDVGALRARFARLLGEA